MVTSAVEVARRADTLVRRGARLVLHALQAPTARRHVWLLWAPFPPLSAKRASLLPHQEQLNARSAQRVVSRSTAPLRARLVRLDGLNLSQVKIPAKNVMRERTPV